MSEKNDPKQESLSRRSFMGAGGALVGAAAFGGLSGCSMPELSGDDDLGTVPRRVLGRTGEEVSILGVGTADMGEGPPDADECASVFAEAIDRGINYIDTARIYGNAEEALAKVLKTRRDKTFLVTKCMTDTRKDAQESFETSLRTMGVDHVDLLHLHSTGDRDLDTVLANNGMWDYFLDLKKQGKTRFLGITGHNRPGKFLRMLDTKQVDVMMVAMNFVDQHIYGFENKVLPRARELGVGVMAMKVFGGIRGGFNFVKVRRPSQMNQSFLSVAVRYALNLDGVHGAVIGVHDSEELRQNIRFVQNAPKLSEVELEALSDMGERIAPDWGARFGAVDATA